MRNPFNLKEITDPRCFYGRSAVVRDLLEIVASAQSCAIVGEPHIGKSSLLAYLADPRVQTAHSLDAERILSVTLDFLELQGCSAQKLWIEIMRKLAVVASDEKIRRMLKTTADRRELRFGDFQYALRELKTRGFRVVLLCDEFEMAVQNPQFDEHFFGAMRSLVGLGVAFVTTSRLNLRELKQYRGEAAQQKVLGSPFFNIFTTEFGLGPFEDYEVAEMLAGSLAETPIRFALEDIEFLDRIAGRHPHFLQLGAYHLYAELTSSGPGRPTAGGSARGDAVGSGLSEIHHRVRKRVGQESASIFRDLWRHSGEDERGALLALAAATKVTAPSDADTLDIHVLDRLVQCGLARRGKSGTSPFCRLFSELLDEWIGTNLIREGTGEVAGSSVTTGVRDKTQTLPLATVESPDPDRYPYEEELGRGAIATVIKAWDHRLERMVAIKLLNLELRAQPERFEQLLQEARICGSLQNPSIVVIYDIDVERGFLVEEFLAGGSLRDLLEVMPTLPLPDIVAVAEQLASALDAAHQAGVVHRDLKPKNVLLTARYSVPPPSGGAPNLPPVKLADFGSALRLEGPSEGHSTIGTLAYMAPEQLTGKGIGPAADFYALGVVLFEMLHGYKPPPAGKTTGNIEGKEPSPLDTIISRCLAANPTDRFTSAEAFLTSLRSVQL